MSMHSCAVHVTFFSNSSIIPTGFKFTELHALTYALLPWQRFPSQLSPMNPSSCGTISKNLNEIIISIECNTSSNSSVALRMSYPHNLVTLHVSDLVLPHVYNIFGA